MMALSSMDTEISHFEQGLGSVKLVETVVILERQVSEGSKRDRTYDFEVLDSNMASGVKKTLYGDFKKRVFIEAEAAQQSKRFLAGRRIAWMIYEYFKIGVTDEIILDSKQHVKS